MFDPGELWTRASDFERELMKFFYSKGKEVMLIQPVGNSGKTIWYILPSEATDPSLQKQMTTKPTGVNKGR